MLALPNRLVNDVALPLRRWLTGDSYRSAARLRSPEDPRPPKRLERELDLRLTDRNGWPVYEAWPRDRATRASILYLHGGGYVNEITRWHWLLVRRLALDCDSQRLTRMARDAGVPIDLHEVESAPHAFPVLPSRQGAAGRRGIVHVCRRHPLPLGNEEPA